jgi:hypothetical protein
MNEYSLKLRLRGWGGRDRTSEWRNQNPSMPFDILSILAVMLHLCRVGRARQTPSFKSGISDLQLLKSRDGILSSDRVEKRFAAILALLLATIPMAAPDAFAQYSLSLNVALSGQVTDYYCGAASSQMTMMGYPVQSTRQCLPQDKIYATIQKLKQDPNFYSDPDGVRDALRTLDPPAANDDFAISSDSNRDLVMHNILYSMSARNYPPVVLVEGGDHWVVITGFKTDVDPKTGRAVLQELNINDPWPPPAAPQHNPCISGSGGNVGGLVRTVTGASWYSNDWQSPNKYGSKWLNKYIAVIGSAQTPGVVTAKEEVNTGEVIQATKAVKVAEEYVEQHKLAERYPDLQHARATRALLVNRTQNAYFLVPFESEGMSRFVALINAHTGEFQEFGALNEPLRYFSEIDVLSMARSSIVSTTQGPLSEATTELVYSRSLQMKNRYLPVWKVTVKAGEIPITRYITHRGEVLTEITQRPLGGQ